jgi:hypothetical protein
MINPDLTERLVVRHLDQRVVGADPHYRSRVQVKALAGRVVEEAGAARGTASAGVVDEAAPEGEVLW